MGRCDIGGDGQAQPGATMRPTSGIIDAVEAVEQSGQCCIGYTRCSILQDHDRLVTLLGNPQVALPAGVGVAVTVFQQIAQQLGQTARVTVDPNRIFESGVQLNVFISKSGCPGVHSLPDDFSQVKCLTSVIQSAQVGQGEVIQIVYQPAQRLDLGM